MRNTPSIISNMPRIRFSETGLSTTTTSSGLLDEARTKPQLPSFTVACTPLMATRSRIAWPQLKNAARGDNPQRDETRLYKIDIFKRPFRLLQNHTSSEDDRFRELPYCREILQGKSR
ncbi:hypothetical protein ACVILL_000883 [Bradyrhizobium sp. USDA 3364]